VTDPPSQCHQSRGTRERFALRGRVNEELLSRPHQRVTTPSGDVVLEFTHFTQPFEGQFVRYLAAQSVGGGTFLGGEVKKPAQSSWASSMNSSVDVDRPRSRPGNPEMKDDRNVASGSLGPYRGDTFEESLGVAPAAHRA